MSTTTLKPAMSPADVALSGAGSPVECVTAYLERERDPLLGCPIPLAAGPT